MAPSSKNAAASSSRSSNPNAKKLLRYRGHQHFRQRLILSVLSGKSVRIDGIREDEVEVGLRDYEVSFLRLIEKITNGSTIEISYTGTTVLLHPGMLPGGIYTHKCPESRSVGYWLEGIIPLGVFGKKPLEITLEGITGEEGKDLSVDMIRTVTLPHLHLFGITEGLELQIKKRGAPPLGGGLVIYRSPITRSPTTLNFLAPGKIKRIRGIAYSTRVSPQFANRMVEAVRGVLNGFLPDVYIYTDVYKGEESGRSPGYGLTLMSLSTTSSIHSSEVISVPPPTSTPTNTITSSKSIISANVQLPTFQTPEDMAQHAARLLLEDIAKGGCVDERHQWLVLLLMVLGREDVGRVRMGKLSGHSIQYLRDLNDYFGVRFKIVPFPSGTPAGGTTNEDGELDSNESGGEEEDDNEEEEEILGVKIKTGRTRKGPDGKPVVAKLIPEEWLVSCVGIGYGNVNKSAA